MKVYWEVLRRRNREDLVEKSMLTNEDFEKLEIVIARSRYSLADLLDIFSGLFRERVDGDAAREAFLELGLKLDPESARDRIAYILAGWLLEASKYWRIISFKVT